MTVSGVTGRIRQDPRRIREVSLIVAGILLFALFIHNSFPLRITAFAALAMAALLMAWSTRGQSLWISFGLGPFRKRVLYFLAPSALLGAALAWLTRSTFDLSPLPRSLAIFVFVAPLVGAVEELIFRGFIQGRLRSLGPVFSILYTSAVHTAYKLLVILSLGTPLQFDFFFLILWTFLGGLSFGALREGSGNVLPAILAHALFDILLYGGHVVAPVWVWS